MQWIVNIEEVQEGRVVSRRKVMSIDRPDTVRAIEDIGLHLAEGKAILARIQSLLVERQFVHTSKARANCPSCGKQRRIKDYRDRYFHTVYGRVAVRQPRFSYTCQCGVSTPPCDFSNVRSTPEFDALRVKLAAHLPYRVVSAILTEILPVSGGHGHTTIREQTLAMGKKIDDQLTDPVDKKPASSTMTLGMDTAYVRTNHRIHGYWHALVGYVEDGQLHRVFGALKYPLAENNPKVIRSNLDKLGYNLKTDLTVLTDGEEGLRTLAREATHKDIVPVLDWFHIAMKLQPIEQSAKALRTRTAGHVRARKAMVEALEQLHWRLWHNKPGAMDRCVEIVSRSVRAFRRYSSRRQHQATRRIMSMLHTLQRYLQGQESTLVNYGEWYRKGKRISTSVVESTVNVLVNRRMNKRQQMRWSADGAHSMLLVRATVLNGEFDHLVSQREVAAFTPSSLAA